MPNIKRQVLWATLVLIFLLTVFSVYGAFLGANRAQVFFNSIPLAICWSLFLVLLVAGGLVFQRLIRVPALLLIHTGCIAILIGGLWGSSKGQEIRKKVFKCDIIGSGYVMLYPGQQTSQIQVGEGKDMQIKNLPFVVAVDDFRIEHYNPGKLFIGVPGTENQWSMTADPNSQLDFGNKFGAVKVVRFFENLQITKKLFITVPGTPQEWSMSVAPNTQLDLGETLGSVKVLRAFKNFRITVGGEGGSQAYEAPGPGTNAALEILLIPPRGEQPTKHYIFEMRAGHANKDSPLSFEYKQATDNTGENLAYDDVGSGDNAAVELLVTAPSGGPATPRYVFEQQPSHAQQGSPLAFQYRRTISDYISDVKILKKTDDKKAVTQKAVEVNHPLYYGGYHFYQSSYGQDPRGSGQMYTVLSVTNSTGLGWVFTGFLLMCLGIAWQCWVLDIRKVLRQEAL